MPSNKKNNKTSHVMNLLTNGTSPEGGAGAEAAADTPAGSAQEKKGDVQSHTVTPSKVTVVDEGSRNDRLSQEIFNKLSEELEEEAAPGNASPQGSLEEAQDKPEAQSQEDELAKMLAQDGSEEVSGQDAAPQNQEGALPETGAEPSDEPQEPQPAPQAEAAQANPANAQAPASAAEEAEEMDGPNKPAHHAIIPKSQLGSNLSHREYRFVNVMEQLILRQDMSKVLEQYNVCTCTRCIADVCALTLSALPAKYVVTSKDSISPLLSYYESRNKIPMLTAMIKACNMVRDNPRH